MKKRILRYIPKIGCAVDFITAINAKKFNLPKYLAGQSVLYSFSDKLEDVGTQRIPLQKEIEPFFACLDLMSGDGPTIGDFIIFEYFIKDLKIKKAELNLSEISVLKSSIDITVLLFDQILLHYLIEDIGIEKRGDIFKKMYDEFGTAWSSHFILYWLFQTQLDSVQRRKIKRKSEAWQMREVENVVQMITLEENIRTIERFQRISGMEVMEVRDNLSDSQEGTDLRYRLVRTVYAGLGNFACNAY